MSSNATASCASIEATMKPPSATTAGADKNSRATTEAQCARATPAASGVVEVEQLRCECCGLEEECTPAYIARVRSLHCGRWVCGLCAEAVKDERGKAGGGRLDEGVEDALRAHMSFCMDFNKSERMSPVTHIAAAMRRLLRRSMDAGSGSRSAPSSPRRSIVSRSNSCITSLPRECTTTTSLESLLSSTDARSASFRSAASFR